MSIPSLPTSLLPSIDWYPIRANAIDRVEVLLPNEVKHAKNVVYCFFNQKKNKCLIGVTANLVSRRVSNYMSAINRYQSDNHNKFYRDIKNNPADFKFGILAVCAAAADLMDREVHFIETLRKTHKVYNQNRGGGGSTIIRKCSPSKFSLRARQLLNSSPRSIRATIPTKSYPVVKTIKGTLRIALTPSGAKKRGTVYGISNGRGNFYVGKSEKKLQDRMYGHNHLIKKNEHELAVAINKNPDEFRAVVLHENSWGLELCEMEKLFIRALDSVKNGYNANTGGGGGGAL